MGVLFEESNTEKQHRPSSHVDASPHTTSAPWNSGRSEQLPDGLDGRTSSRALPASHGPMLKQNMIGFDGHMVEPVIF